MPDLRPLAWIAISLAVAGGFAEFGHAREPGSAEAGGVRLNALVDNSRGALSNDWVTAGSGAAVRSLGAGLEIRASSADIDLMSRSLSVFPHDCYRLRLRAYPRQGRSALRVRDELGRRILGTFRLAPSSRPRAYAFAFDTAGHQRLALTVEAPAGAVLDLSDVQIQRDTAARRCPPLS